MSGHPNPNQVQQLVQAAEMINQLDARADELHVQIGKDQEELKRVNASRSSNAKTLHELVTKMDCAAMGNYGWEGRIVNLMAMVVEQSKKGVRLE